MKQNSFQQFFFLIVLLSITPFIFFLGKNFLLIEFFSAKYFCLAFIYCFFFVFLYVCSKFLSKKIVFFILFCAYFSFLQFYFFDIQQFLKIYKDIITKPLYGNGGEGINRSNNDKLVGIDSTSEYLDMPMIAQKYIPEIIEGDRRIIFFDGEYVGSVARIPKKGNIKANFHAGGIAKKTNLVFRDHEIIEKVGRELKELDLFFCRY